MATLKIKIDAEIVFDDDNKVDDNLDTIIDDIVEYYRKKMPLTVKAMGL